MKMAAAIDNVRLRHSAAPAPRMPVLRFLGLLAAITAALTLLSDSPRISILLADTLVCAYLASLFSHPSRIWFFIHPPVLALCSQSFQVPFLDGGDGLAYLSAIGRYLDVSDSILSPSGLNEDEGLFRLLKDASFGILPVLLLPNLLFGVQPDDVFYLWQGLVHAVLCSLAVLLGTTWDSPSARHLLRVGLFAVVSPSFFDLGTTPTRHIVTFFGVFLLYLSYAALLKRITVSRVLGLLLAILAVLISKAQLLFPFLIFCIVSSIAFPLNRKNPASIAILCISLVAGTALAPTLIEQYLAFDEVAQSGAATFSGLTDLPVVGWVAKYVFAILSPFPWSNAAFFVATDYGGNWVLFICHVLSSLTGLYIVLSLTINFKELRRSTPELNMLLLYGTIMSLSILRGATGFHTYLLIYFPFFAPLLSLERFKVPLFAPVTVALALDLFVTIAR